MDYTKGDVLNATSHLIGVTIPVHVSLDSEQVVLSQPEMRELLDSAETIAVGNCICREGDGKCDNQLEVCLALDAEGKKKIEEHGWRKVSQTEAMELLDVTYRQGLVHMAYRRAHVEGDTIQEGDISFVCSCCSCCCGPLNGLRRFKYSDAIAQSAYVARLDAESCIGCGTCATRCVFRAYELKEGSNVISFDAEHCFGCGLCVETCPTQAIAFVRR